MIQAELRTYVTPVVTLPPEEPIDPDAAVDSLIDTSETNSLAGDQIDSARNGSISPDVLAERCSMTDIYLLTFLSTHTSSMNKNIAVRLSQN